MGVNGKRGGPYRSSLPSGPWVDERGNACASPNHSYSFRDEPKLPNPDPSNFKITDYEEHLDSNGDPEFLVVEIYYPDCTNFEGKKLLVYRDVCLKSLLKSKAIDPHFNNNSKLIARFVPNAEGWKIANKLCEILGD